MISNFIFCLQCKIEMVFSHWWYILLIYPRRIRDVLLGTLIRAANFALEHPEENSILSLILPSTADVLYFRGKKNPFSILLFASGIRTNVFMLLVFFMLNFIVKNKGTTLKAFSVRLWFLYLCLFVFHCLKEAAFASSFCREAKSQSHKIEGSEDTEAGPQSQG